MLALATEVIFVSVPGSITSKRAPSEDLRHLPPIHRSVGTFASRFSYIAIASQHAVLSVDCVRTSYHIRIRLCRFTDDGEEVTPLPAPAAQTGKSSATSV